MAGGFGCTHRDRRAMLVMLGMAWSWSAQQGNCQGGMMLRMREGVWCGLCSQQIAVCVTWEGGKPVRHWQEQMNNTQQPDMAGWCVADWPVVDW